MSKLPKIVKDLTGDNYVIDESINRMEGKTIKKAFRGTRESIKQVSILNMHILHQWRAGKPRPYGFDTY